ncbi:aminoglycoside phosphotransferase family protein [Micromonospora sp. NPDC049044]|uniref:aminoglycoside phosphotransferase family protein n=1 Tax=unclassified Micromonospora TaxID=2617518 RepID=UPI0034066638
MAYLPLGFGSYHWSVTDRCAAVWFVKVDDLGFAEAGRDAEFDRLRRSFETALALHREAGLDFILAPVPAGNEAPLRRLSSRYALSVFSMVDGTAGEFGPYPRDTVVEMAGLLGQLHRATAVVAHLAPRADLRLPGRDGLNAALADLERPWTAGPYAESARKLLAVHEERVRAWLDDFDRLVDEVRESGTEWVITHGEPHPGNVMRTAAGTRMIDWATVQIAPLERDLWMLTDAFGSMLGADTIGADDEVLAHYTRVSGRTVTPAGLALYRRWWPLADVAAFVVDLRRPHDDGEDTAAALEYLALNLGAAPA